MLRAAQPDKLIYSFIKNHKSNKINEKEMTRKESTDYCKNFALNFLNLNKVSGMLLAEKNKTSKSIFKI